jgi:hypothetical protein
VEKIDNKIKAKGKKVSLVAVREIREIKRIKIIMAK